MARNAPSKEGADIDGVWEPVRRLTLHYGHRSFNWYTCTPPGGPLNRNAMSISGVGILCVRCAAEKGGWSKAINVVILLGEEPPWKTPNINEKLQGHHLFCDLIGVARLTPAQATVISLDVHKAPRDIG